MALLLSLWLFQSICFVIFFSLVAAQAWSRTDEFCSPPSCPTELGRQQESNTESKDVSHLNHRELTLLPYRCDKQLCIMAGIPDNLNMYSSLCLLVSLVHHFQSHLVLPYPGNTKRKTQGSPESVHCSFMKWEDHKVIKTASKRMADLAVSISDVPSNHSSSCVCVFAVDQTHLRCFPVWCRLN